MKTLRDLVATKATADTCLQGSARGEGPEASSGLFHEDELRLRAMMPGDDPGSHPHGGESAFSANNPQAILRALREGSLTPEQERQARAALNRYSRLTGEPIGGPAKP